MLRVLTVSTLLFATLTTCMSMQGRPGHGLIGYGINMYKPECAYTCRAALSAGSLSCTTETMSHDDGMGMMMESETSPECYATDDAFLQSLAYCLSVKCTDTPLWDLEHYWSLNVAGGNLEQPLPKESYQQALAKVVTPPTQMMESAGMLMKTMLVNEDDYLLNFNGQTGFETSEDVHERYGYVKCIVRGSSEYH
jgi:hypothetical protein